jgi:hypothetical protein
MEYKAKELPGGLSLVVWENIKEDDDAQVWDKFGTWATIEVSGDAGGVAILGSILGDTLFPLDDLDTMPLNFTRPGIKSTNAMFTRIKPQKTGSGEATVAMIIRR